VLEELLQTRHYLPGKYKYVVCYILYLMDREDGRSISEAAKQARRNTIVRMRNAGRSYKETQEATGAQAMI